MPLAAVVLRFRVSLPDTEPIESQPHFFDDEVTAIARGKRGWPRLYEMALMDGTPQEITVVNHQGRICWERRAPIHLTRDHSMQDDDWVLYVLQQHGPLTTQHLVALCGLKMNTIRACLQHLEHKHSIYKCGEFKQSSPGRPAVIWDITEALSS